MEVPTLKIDPKEARAQLRKMRRAKHRQAEAKYAELESVYAAAGRGKKLLDVHEAILWAGFKECGRPELAIARADRRRVRFTWGGGRRFRFDSHARPGFGAYSAALVHEVTAFEPHGRVSEHGYTEMLEGYASVPLVPAELRPAKDLNPYHILWEVEEWRDTDREETIDPDPMLLRHLVGTIYTIECVWELSDLERRVLEALA